MIICFSAGSGDCADLSSKSFSDDEFDTLYKKWMVLIDRAKKQWAKSEENVHSSVGVNVRTQEYYDIVNCGWPRKLDNLHRCKMACKLKQEGPFYEEVLRQ